MNDVIININEKNGVAYKKICNQKLGNQHQNLQNKLKFEFIDTDNIPKGIAWLEYENDGNKNYALMEEYEKGYQIDIKSCLLISDHVEVDLKITQEENPNGIPVFVSSIVKFEVERTINAEEEEPDQYPSWFESANAKLVEFDNAEKIRNDNEQAREDYIDNLKSDVDDGKFNGATFTPSVDSEGNLSFTNDKGLDNPETVNIRGPQGADYIFTEQDKKEVVNETYKEILEKI